MLLKGLENIQQKQYSDCLVACSQQALGYLGIQKSDRWLWNHLATSQGEYGVFTYLINLADSLGVVVELHKDGTVDLFAQYIESGLPIIVAVSGDRPTQWPYYQDHAVVVIGFDDEYIYVNDPAQTETAMEVEIRLFEYVWSRRDYQFAVIRLT